MYYDMSWGVEFKTEEGKRYSLNLLADCQIVSSVENLADTATIVLPEADFNNVFDVQNTLPRGTEVIIKLGYNDDLKQEFSGFITELETNDSSLKIVCEDALFLFRTAMPNIELKESSLLDIANYLTTNVNPEYTVSCDFGITYEKFVIQSATGYDVLKKLQSETKANIYFDTENKILHVHPPYLEQSGKVAYSLQENVEQSNLEYKRAIDKKVEVVVESTNLKGIVSRVTKGTTGGDKITLKVSSVSPADIDKIADAELLKHSADKYEGSFDAWLVPEVKPTYTAIIEDSDYPYKEGRYYVVSVTTGFNPSGGKRTVQLGVKLN